MSMSFWSPAFDRPWYLLWLALLPLVWWYGFPRLAALGDPRRWLVLGARSIVLIALVAALADLQWRRASDRLTVIFLLDQSASIPSESRGIMIRYVREEVRKHRNAAAGDRAGVIVFGREAAMEVPPLDDELPLVDTLDSVSGLSQDATNLESALEMAQATFPEDSAKRLVIVTDGNENLGNAGRVARRMVTGGVSVDVIEVRRPPGSDVLVERVLLPSDVRRGQAFEARVVLNHEQAGGNDLAPPLRGKLLIQRKRGGVAQTISEEEIELPPGKTVLNFRDELAEPDFYEYEASFVPLDAAADPVRRNNAATAFTQIRGQGHILILEDSENRGAGGTGEAGFLAERLRTMDLEVTVRFTDELFQSLAELQPYDCVILADVSRSSLVGSDDALANFSDEQIEMLAQNTRQLGCGLIMLGGRNSFGAGGWSNTALEKAMPVDFQIKNSKVQAIGALAMVMHASEMADGNHWQKVIAREALKVLGPFDYCGVIHWGAMSEEWLWHAEGRGIVRVGQNKPQMLARLDRMSPGDMPDFEPSLRLAAAGFGAVADASVKHMIVISDGDPTPPQFSGGALSQLKRMGVKVTTVAVGTHGPAGSTPLRNIANFTGGKYYVATSAKALPRIFQREARRVTKPLIVEKSLQPALGNPHEILRNIDGFPPITGFVMTTLKKNPLVEVPLLSPFPAETENATLLATWTYGVGRTAAWTTDSGARWTNAWTSWEQYDKFFGQLVRWAMRPTQDSGDYAVATQFQEGRIQVMVENLNPGEEAEGGFLSGSWIDPRLESHELPLQRVAPARFSGELEATTPGSYFITIRPNPSSAPIRVGVDVPYSPEYRYRETNEVMLAQLAALTPPQGKAGRVYPEPLADNHLSELLAQNAFRRDLPPAISSRQLWPWLLLFAGTVFFSDILMRRVAIDVGAIGRRFTAWRTRRRAADAAAEDRLRALRQRKEEVSEEIERRKSATRFEPSVTEDEQSAAESWAELQGESRPAAPPTSMTNEPAGGPKEDAPSFTSRLLKVKQQSQRDASKPESRGPPVPPSTPPENPSPDPPAAPGDPSR